MNPKQIRKALKILAAVVVLIFPLVVQVPYYVHILFLIFLFSTMGLGWNLIGGYGAQLALGHSVFFAIGAYTSVLLVIYSRVTPWIGGVLGMILAVIAAFFIGLPCFRLRGPYFALATIASGEITRTLLLHFQDFTKGANGIPLSFHGTDPLYLQFNSKAPYYYLALALLASVFVLVRRMEREKIGRYLAAIREDQDAAESLGVQSHRVKLAAFMFSAATAALCGVLYAFAWGYIDPDGVSSLNLSIEIATVVIVGGIGTLWGPVLGSAVVVFLTELTNMYLGSLRSGASLVMYGLLLIVVILARPRGLISLFDRFKTQLPSAPGSSAKEPLVRGRSA
jgi:branched-chain amino acid transport system permease protein